jgi:Rrf2 family protein
MKVSTKGRYGLRVLLDVAMHQDKGPVILRDIARRQAISEKYLWQVINPLKGAGLVSSARGAHGGYLLAKEPGTISLLDVVSIMEGPVALVDCADSPETCDRSAVCAARDVWGSVEAKLREAMAGITLRELIDKQKGYDAGGTLSFVI